MCRLSSAHRAGAAGGVPAAQGQRGRHRVRSDRAHPHRATGPVGQGHRRCELPVPHARVRRPAHRRRGGGRPQSRAYELRKSGAAGEGGGRARPTALRRACRHGRRSLFGGVLVRCIPLDRRSAPAENPVTRWVSALLHGGRAVAGVGVPRTAVASTRPLYRLGWSRSGPRRIVMCIVFGLAAALTLASARAEPLPRTILFLDEDTPIHPWFRQMSEAFYATIRTDTANPTFVFVENLGIDAYGTEEYFNILRSHFREKYRNKAIGVIVSNASRALPYTLRLRDELWPGTPVVLAGIQERRAARLSLPPNVTGFTFRHQLHDIVATADALIPGLKRVVLAGSRIERGGWRQDFLDDLPDIRAKFEVLDLTDLSLAELRQRLTELPGDSAVVCVGARIGEH